jgi:hypothetical protein
MRLQNSTAPPTFNFTNIAGIETSAPQTFYPSSTFQGAREGFNFKVGPKGIGYYAELKMPVSAPNPLKEAAVEIVDFSELTSDDDAVESEVENVEMPKKTNFFGDFAFGKKLAPAEAEKETAIAIYVMHQPSLEVAGTFSVFPSAKVDSIKTQLLLKTGIPISRQQLAKAGDPNVFLSNHQTFASAGIASYSSLYLSQPKEADTADSHMARLMAQMSRQAEERRRNKEARRKAKHDKAAKAAKAQNPDNEELDDEDAPGNDNGRELGMKLFQDTVPLIKGFDGKNGQPLGVAHPDVTVETTSLSAVEPPLAVTKIALPPILIEAGKLSMLQLTSTVFAQQRFEKFLPSGERGGFFLGDGAGIGKGRQIAALVYENALRGREKSCWFSVSQDLKEDAGRDFKDIGYGDEDLFKLSDHKTGVKLKKPRGVLFSTYHLLVMKPSCGNGKSRFDQIVEWLGDPAEFSGLLVFDESHKAKNITQTFTQVVALQAHFPKARVIYVSATGASNPEHMRCVHLLCQLSTRHAY